MQENLEVEDQNPEPGSAWKSYAVELKQRATPVAVSKPKITDHKIVKLLPILGALVCAFMFGRASTITSNDPKVNGSANLGGPNNWRSIMSSEHGINLGLRYDPYLSGYMRETGFQFASQSNQNVYESYVLDPSVKPPPPGVTVRIVRPDLQGRYRTVTGGPGVPNGVFKEALAETIQSLIAFEERQRKIEGDIPTVSYENAPWQPNIASFQGQPHFVGWHDIEVETEKGKWRFLLPDHRYVNGREAEYQKTLKIRLHYHIDQKVFSNLGPFGSEVPGESTDFGKEIKFPNGVSMILHDNKHSYYVRGPQFEPSRISQDLEVDLETLSQGMKDLFGQIASLEKFRSMSDSEAKRFMFSARVVFPMGEHQYWLTVHDLRNLDSEKMKSNVKSWCYAVGFALSGLRTGPRVVTRYQTPPNQVIQPTKQSRDQDVLARYK